MNGEKFLKKKFQNIHTSKEVVAAAKRAEVGRKEKVSNNPERRIENYLNRLQEVVDMPESEEKRRKVRMFKHVMFRDYVIKESEIPARVYELEQEIAFDQGHEHVEITEEFKHRKNDEIITGQKNSLSSWIEYLSSSDAAYPMWAKYWAFRSILKVGKYNKQRKSFEKRGKNSVAPFPTLNAGAVAKAISIIQEKIKGGEIENFSNLNDEEFQKVLNKEDFAKLYAVALESMPEFSEKGLENTKGEWVIYEQIPYEEKYLWREDNEDLEDYIIHPRAQKLFDSLQGYPLEWCTAQNLDTAQSQLLGGDFYVYYSEDDSGKNKIPRAAIRMENESIAEVRGIEQEQEMDQFILPVVEEKMQDFGQEGEQYKKKVADMKMLKNLYNRSFKKDPRTEEKEFLNPDFSKDELRFLYQIDGPVEGFGYFYENRYDPYEMEIRLKEIMDLRKGEVLKNDLLALFENENTSNDKDIDEKYEEYAYLKDELAGRRVRYQLDDMQGLAKNEKYISEQEKRKLLDGAVRVISREDSHYLIELVDLHLGISLLDIRNCFERTNRNDYIFKNINHFYPTKKAKKQFLEKALDRSNRSNGFFTDEEAFYYPQAIMEDLTDFNNLEKVELFLKVEDGSVLINNISKYFKVEEYESVINECLDRSINKGGSPESFNYASGSLVNAIMNISEKKLGILEKAKIFMKRGELNVILYDHMRHFADKKSIIINDEFISIIGEHRNRKYALDLLVSFILSNKNIKLSYKSLTIILETLLAGDYYFSNVVSCFEIMTERVNKIETIIIRSVIDYFLQRIEKNGMLTVLHRIIAITKYRIGSFEEPEKVAGILENLQNRLEER